MSLVSTSRQRATSSSPSSRRTGTPKAVRPCVTSALRKASRRRGRGGPALASRARSAATASGCPALRIVARAGRDDDVEAAVEQRPLARDAPDERLVVAARGGPACRRVPRARIGRVCERYASTSVGDDAHQDLKRVRESVQEAAVAGEDRLLLRLRLQREVHAASLEHGAVVAAAQPDHVAADLVERAVAPARWPGIDAYDAFPCSSPIRPSLVALRSLAAGRNDLVRSRRSSGCSRGRQTATRGIAQKRSSTNAQSSAGRPAGRQSTSRSVAISTIPIALSRSASGNGQVARRAVRECEADRRREQLTHRQPGEARGRRRSGASGSRGVPSGRPAHRALHHPGDHAREQHDREARKGVDDRGLARLHLPRRLPAADM